MTKTREHWNEIFSSTADTDLGWHETDASQTLKYLDLMSVTEPATVLVAGAGTSLLIDRLLERGHKLILNDISDAALTRLRQRVGESEKIMWLQHDIAQPLPLGLPLVDIWIDRAVLHFLLDEVDIHGYFTNVRSLVKPGGYALLAEFSTSGSPRCAGLELHRYSVDELTTRMDSGFDLVSHEEYTYINPFGGERAYIYALYRRIANQTREPAGDARASDLGHD